MRKRFADLLLEGMRKQKNIILLTADMGYRTWDAIAKEFPDRFYNVGAAEQAMVGIAAGLALAGKIPLCYSITPFLLYRPFELIRNFLNHERLPVKLVGCGRGREYGPCGFTHWCEDDVSILACLPNIECFRPESPEDLASNVTAMLTNGLPVYLSLAR